MLLFDSCLKLPTVYIINYIPSLVIQGPEDSHFPNLLPIHIFLVTNLIYLFIEHLP